MTDEVAEALHKWRPAEREFVIFTKADWERVGCAVRDKFRLLDDVEYLPVELDVPERGEAPGWWVRCQDGNIRHDEPFTDQWKAMEWANQGHACAARHEYEEVVK